MANDAVLAALAAPVRRRIVELLAQSPQTATELHRAFPIAGPAVSRHLRVLRDAGLITVVSAGDDRRVRLYRLVPERLEALGGWLAAQSQSWQRQLDSFQGYVTWRTQT